MTEQRSEKLPRLVIVGAGGFSREVAQLVCDINAVKPSFVLQGFVDDRKEITGQVVGDWPVIGTVDDLIQARFADAWALGVGSPATKRQFALRLARSGLTAPPLVHPSAVVGRNVRIGEGVIVCAGNILTCDIVVGRFVTLNLSCTVGHDSRIGAFATLAPGVHVSGNVTVGEGADLGTGSATVQGKSVGTWTIIGAGAVIASDIPANCTAVGVPARVIKERPVGWHES